MTLTYNQDSTFKIMQITDTHIGNMPFHEDDHKTFEAIRKVLTKVQCDLVIHTGDMIWSDGVKDAHIVFEKFLSIFNEFDIPLAITFGNHDSEEIITRSDLRRIYSQVIKNQVTTTDEYIIEDRMSSTINIYDSEGKEIKNTLYLIDSGAGCDDEISEYDWVYPDQIDWFKKISKKYKKGDRIKRNIVFQHIPVPEYWESRFNILSGMCLEENDTISSPKLNTGLFSAMYLNGEIWGMSVGHDHDNNFDSSHFGLHLVYGQVSGYQCYGELKRGVRIFELNQADQSIKTHTVLFNEI